MLLTPFRSLVKRSRRPARRPRTMALPLCLEPLETRTLLSTTTWLGSSSNIWNSPTSWSNGVPGPGDTAVFTTTSGSHTAVVDQAFTIGTLSIDANWNGTILVNNPLSVTAGLSLGSCSITGNAAITIAGSSQWTAGNIQVGSAGMTNSGTLTIANLLNTDVFLFGDGILTNAGTIIQSGAGRLNIESSFTNATTLLNQAGAVYDLQADTTIVSSSGGGTFTSLGTLRKSVGDPTKSAAIQIAFSISNAIDVQAGVLKLQSSSGTVSGGNFTVGQNATLDLTGGATVTYTGTYTGSGLGTVSLNSGTVAVGSAGATFNFPAGLFQFTGGGIFIPPRAQLTNAAAGVITLSNTTAADDFLFGGGTLANAGTIAQAGAGRLNIESSFFNTTTLLNQAGAVYDFRADSTIVSGSGGGTVINLGTLRKSVGDPTKSAAIQVAFNSNSVIDVEAGNLIIHSNGGGLTGGQFTVAANATLDLTGGGTVTYTGTYSASGAGLVTLTGGTLLVGTAGATFNFPAPTFQWSAGNIEVPQGNQLTNRGVIVLANTSNDDFLFGDGVLVNLGTIAQAGTGRLNIESSAANATVLFNGSHATYTFLASSNIVSGSGGGTIVNHGLIRKATRSGSGTATIAVVLNDTGTMDVQTGTLTIQNGGSTITGAVFQAEAGGTLDLAGGSTVTVTGTITGSGAGTVALTNGTVFVGTGGATFNFPTGLFQWTGGTIEVPVRTQLTNAGVLTLSNTTADDFLFGDGTLVNAGTIAQVGAGRLNIESSLTNATTLVNQAGAVYDLQNDGSIVSGSGGGTVVNNGTFKKSGGANTSTIGVVFTDTDTPTSHNSDQILALSGTLSFTTGLTQTNGLIQLGGGALSTTTLNIVGGVLNGAGDVFGNGMNAGVVSPGGGTTVGVLTIHGSYTQTGTLNIDIGAGGNDELVVLGTATLGGTLNVNLLGGFVPAHGQSFQIMTFTSETGTFIAPPGFTESFTPTSLSLVAQ